MRVELEYLGRVTVPDARTGRVFVSSSEPPRDGFCAWNVWAIEKFSNAPDEIVNRRCKFRAVVSRDGDGVPALCRVHAAKVDRDRGSAALASLLPPRARHPGEPVHSTPVLLGMMQRDLARLARKVTELMRLVREQRDQAPPGLRVVARRPARARDPRKCAARG
jgi:hypothetical protein